MSSPSDDWRWMDYTRMQSGEDAIEEGLFAIRVPAVAGVALV